MLVRVLSTGRAGTKFIANAFADQGYRAYHEGLYAGEPTSALILYTRMLGDMWFQESGKYYSFDSNFATPYIAAVQEALELDSAGIADPKNSGRLARLRKGKLSAASQKAVIDSGHRLSTATPLIEREGARVGLEIKYLILFRNPLRTIHGLFKVESQPGMMAGPYRNRPASFSESGDYLGAADIWANTYRMAQDQRMHLGEERFALLDLDRFNFDEEYIEQIFAFLKLDFDKQRFSAFANQVLKQPLRSTKHDSARNSHIFHDPEFSFSNKQIAQIYERVKDVLDLYGIDWSKVVGDYQRFHAIEKEGLGFEKK